MSKLRNKQKVVKLMSRRWGVLALITLGIGLGGYLIGHLVRNKVDIAQVSGDGAVRLVLSPSSASIAANTKTTLNIEIYAHGISVGETEIKMAYSSSCATPVISNGNFFPTADLDGANKPVIGNGQIAFRINGGSTGESQGEGILAKITTGPTTGPCLLSFLEGTRVVSGGSLENKLGSASDAVINVLNTAVAPASITISPTLTTLSTSGNNNFVFLNLYLSTTVPLRAFQTNMTYSSGCGRILVNGSSFKMFPGVAHSAFSGGQFTASSYVSDGSVAVQGSGTLFGLTVYPSGQPCRVSLIGGRMLTMAGVSIPVVPAEAIINVQGMNPLPNTAFLTGHKPSDLNTDGRVDIYDYGMLLRGEKAYTQADYNLLLANFEHLL